MTATTRTPLTEWTLGLSSGSGPTELADGVQALVPGSVLGTLIERGVATDVTVDGVEDDVAWAAAATWTYRTAVPRTGEGSEVRLILEGVDTLATIRVDGRVALETDDMFHRWVVDLGRDAAPGEWSVEVEFAPVEPAARAAQEAHPLPRADMYDLPFNQVRKMACSFGWDWGPTTMTAGLFRPVYVERTPVTRIDRVLLSTDWDGGAVLRGEIVVAGIADGVAVTVDPVDGSGTLLEYRASVEGAVVELDLTVPGAERWDVVGRGAQPRYDVRIAALGSAGEVLDVETRRVGFRSLDLVQQPDAEGVSCEIHINGARVWARGFNWIPADVLPERVTRDKVRALVQEVVATGANMLRVWGGGVIESDDFYEVCDELGVLVWQDYSFACAAYAEDDAQAARVEREVEDAVRRVGHRASLALWCGCNENLWGYEDWGWKEQLDSDGWGARLYYEVIPRALAQFDPRRPYIPGSPFSPDRDRHPNDQTQGTTHHWDTWNHLDYVHFEDNRSRFASEFGWQAPASWATLTKGLGHEPVSGADHDLQRLQKHPAGQAALDRAIVDHVPHLPQDGRGWYFATQLVQARAIRASIGRFRSLHDTCSGALWWQLNDCWPALSWAVIDVAGRRKLAWHAAVETMAARAVITTADGTTTGVTLVNDLPVPWHATGAVRVVNEAGDIVYSRALDLTVPADSHVMVEPGDVPQGGVAVVVDAGGVRGTRWLMGDLELAHPEARLSLEGVTCEGGAAKITVRAQTLVRDLVLLAETDERLAEVTVDRQLLLLLPGERVTLTVRGPLVEALETGEWAELLAAGTPLHVSVRRDAD